MPYEWATSVGKKIAKRVIAFLDRREEHGLTERRLLKLLKTTSPYYYNPSLLGAQGQIRKGGPGGTSGVFYSEHIALVIRAIQDHGEAVLTLAIEKLGSGEEQYLQKAIDAVITEKRFEGGEPPLT